jgi:hypothetical protein
MTCIDLRTVGPYRPINEHTGKLARLDDDPWNLVLPGRAGFVAPWDRERLVACTWNVQTTRRILATVPDAIVTQDGDDGANITFPVEQLDSVAGVLRLRKKRIGNADHLKAFQFTPPVPDFDGATPFGRAELTLESAQCCLGSESGTDGGD